MRVLAEQSGAAPTTGPYLTKAYVATKGSKNVSLGADGSGKNLNKRSVARNQAKRRRK